LHHTRCARYSLTNQLLSCANARIQHPPQRSAPGEPGLDELLTGAFYRSALYPLLTRINAYLLRWLRKKHPRLRGRKKAQDAWARACQQRPRYFAHWAWVMTIPAVW